MSSSLLENYLKTKSSVIKKSEQKNSSFVPRGIKHHQISSGLQSRPLIYVLDKYSDGSEINIIYSVDYFLFENTIYSLFKKSAFSTIIDNIQLGRIVIIDYDKLRFALEKPIISDCNTHINNAIVSEFSDYISSIEYNHE